MNTGGSKTVFKGISLLIDWSPIYSTTARHSALNLNVHIAEQSVLSIQRRRNTSASYLFILLFISTQTLALFDNHQFYEHI